jgi:hypothetical protein
MKMTLLDTAKTPEQWAQHLKATLGITISPRTIRDRAKETGNCRKLGRALLLTQSHFESLFETPCLNSSKEAITGTSEAVLKAAGNPSEEALAHLTKLLQKPNSRKSSEKIGNVLSLERTHQTRAQR